MAQSKEAKVETFGAMLAENTKSVSPRKRGTTVNAQKYEFEDTLEGTAAVCFPHFSQKTAVVEFSEPQ